MTRRTLTAALLLLSLAGLGTALTLYVWSLEPITTPPGHDAHPHRWWSCTTQVIQPTPPSCLFTDHGMETP